MERVMDERVLDTLKYDSQGLIPAIVQDADTGEVLMMAYMNKQSLADSIRTGKTHFWSRSRQKYWMKGESSGHTQDIQEIFIDCDVDTILIKARQHGAACHEGYKSCFFRKLQADGQWQVLGERLFDPKKVYGKKG
jgi:phosphoribosyl-AMP cyclohydrolase